MTGGRLYVVSAPSGTGKTTLLKRVMRELPGMEFSVSYTTRPPRPGEKEGIDYHFVSPEEFRRMIEAGAFAEWTELHGNYYGTSRDLIEAFVARDADVILDVDTHGARQIRRMFPEGVFIFILPPGIGDLRERLLRRGSESQEMIDLRLRNASKEMERLDDYDYVVVNEEIGEAVEKIKAIIIAERCRRHRVMKELGQRP
ncbi:MAG: guanylate kinase [Deltaproteobacteria bacterium]|nr:guanylate kinase [Deltaproteobacteria bacterium]